MQNGSTRINRISGFTSRHVVNSFYVMLLYKRLSFNCVQWTWDATYLIEIYFEVTPIYGYLLVRLRSQKYGFLAKTRIIYEEKFYRWNTISLSREHVYFTVSIFHSINKFSHTILSEILYFVTTSTYCSIEHIYLSDYLNEYSSMCEVL